MSKKRVETLTIEIENLFWIVHEEKDPKQIELTECIKNNKESELAFLKAHLETLVDEMSRIEKIVQEWRESDNAGEEILRLHSKEKNIEH